MSHFTTGPKGGGSGTPGGAATEVDFDGTSLTADTVPADTELLMRSGTSLTGASGTYYDRTEQLLGIGGAPLNVGAAYGIGGARSPVQVSGSLSGALRTFFVAENSAGAIGAGFMSYANSGPITKLYSATGFISGTVLGIARAACTVFQSAGKILFGTTGTNDVHLGTNDVSRIQILGDGSGIIRTVSDGETPQSVTATDTVDTGKGRVHVSGLAGACVLTLPPSADLWDGYPILVTCDDSVDGTNTVTLTPDGSDVLVGGTGIINTNYGKALITLVGTTWLQVI